MATAPYPNAGSRSARLYERAKQVEPGGSSRLTTYQSPYPIYAAAGDGYRVTDVDGVERIDCVNNMTTLIHGHRHAPTLAAVRAQVEKMTVVAAPTEVELDLAAEMCARVTSVEQIRFANTGTEATMFAIRAARAFTGRNRIAKAQGAYHGAADVTATSVLSTGPEAWDASGRPVTTPDGLGISRHAIEEVVTFPFNDVETTRAMLRENAADLAAVIIDLAPSRMRYPAASRDFADMLQEECRRIGALLIVDEVMSFRLAAGGSQALWGLEPDLSAFGKMIGGGFPVGAIGGSRKVMAVFDHLRGEPFVLHGGTFNANPVSMAAGLATVQAYTSAEVERLNGLGERLREGFRALLRDTNIPGTVQGIGSFAFMGLGDAGGPIRDFRDYVSRTFDPALIDGFHAEMLNRGIFFAQGGTFILSTAMDDDVVDQLIGEARASLVSVGRTAQ